MADLVLLAIIIFSIYTDLRYRRIYNWVVFSAAAGGLALNLAAGGVAGLRGSLAGLLLGVGLLLIPFLLGGIGAGDVKLLGAVGALKGIGFVCLTFAAAALIGGIIGLIAIIKHRSFSTTIPYGPAIGLGTLVAMIIINMSR